MGGVHKPADNEHELLSEPKVRGFDFVDFECDVCVCLNEWDLNYEEFHKLSFTEQAITVQI